MSVKTIQISRLLKGIGLLMIFGPFILSEIRSEKVPQLSFGKPDYEAIETAETYNERYMSGKKCMDYEEVLNQSGTGIMGGLKFPL